MFYLKQIDQGTEALQKLINRKAAGADDTPNELLKYEEDNVTNKVLQLFLKILDYEEFQINGGKT